MVAMAQLIPEDPREKDAVEAVLAAHPELEAFIAEVSAEAHRQFPEVRIELDTMGYDEWDPPLRVLLHATVPWPEYRHRVDEFMDVVRENPGYNRDLVFVFPMWAGPLETYIQR